MLTLTVPWWEIVVRTVVVYVVVLAMLRLAGKRELGQMTPFDLVVILVISNAVQNAMVGSDTSLLGGVIAAATLTAVNIAVGRFGRRIPLFQHVLVGEPRLLLRDGQLLLGNLAKEDITPEEVAMAAREHGVEDLADLSAAILEPDGSISIIEKRGERMRRTRRRFRQFKR